MKAVFLTALGCVLPATAVQASPPPPPPEYVFEASRLLAAPLPPNSDAKLSPLFATDVVVYLNGETIAKDRSEWLTFADKQLESDQRTVIGYSESSGGYSKGGGELLVVDDIDTVDRTHLPPGFLADARMSTRAFLYQFDADGLIHTVRIFAVGGFWSRAR